MPSELYVGKGTSGATYIFDENTNSGKVATVHDPQYAHLFASAPELLEACEAVYQTWESGKNVANVGIMAEIAKTIKKARQQ